MLNGVHDEKRNYFRMKMDCPVIVATEDGSLTLEGRCINLSVKGIMVELGQKFVAGTRLIIRIEPELEISPALSGMLEVLRVDYNVQSGKYQLAGQLETEVVV